MSEQTDDYKVIIGENIKLALKQKGKTQTWLADELDLYKSQLNSYTSGQSMPNPELFKKIADKLGLTVQQLLCRKQILSGETAPDTEIFSADNDEDLKDDFNFNDELKAELQTAINYSKTLEQSTTNKRIKSISNLIKNKVTFVKENLESIL